MIRLPPDKPIKRKESFSSKYFQSKTHCYCWSTAQGGVDPSIATYMRITVFEEEADAKGKSGSTGWGRGGGTMLQYADAKGQDLDAL